MIQSPFRKLRLKKTKIIRVQLNMTGLCNRCHQEKLCWQVSCVACREKRKVSRKHIQTERDYQAKRWAERCVVHSKLSDRKANRVFQEIDYIRPSRLRFLRKIQHNKCIYCGIEFQTQNR